MPENDPPSQFGPDDIIYAYTRAQAIADGVLVDLSVGEAGQLAREAGIRFPVAITATAYQQAILPSDGELPEGQDFTGRLWDVLWMMRETIRRSPPGRPIVHFTVHVWDGKRQNAVPLKVHCGPGDDAEPVLTVMTPEED